LLWIARYKIENEFKEKELKEEQGDTAALIALIFVHPSYRLHSQLYCREGEMLMLQAWLWQGWPRTMPSAGCWRGWHMRGERRTENELVDRQGLWIQVGWEEVTVDWCGAHREDAPVGGRNLPSLWEGWTKMSAMSATVSPCFSFGSFSLNSFSILYLAIHSNPRLLLS
jgi:hypothetical protein